MIVTSDLLTFDFDVVTVNPQGEEVERIRSSAKYRVEELGQGVILEMVTIPSGTFLMGANKTEEGRLKNQNTQHLITIQPFFFG
ncbi:hypothetical protein [[Phormidium ambiguum] IAM M-71]|uniref:hypothetical protein n=1 Tax=[Phormidium ambiguum] IAM M-71 TaxID=454136 RepID=UPI002698D6F5|nr:hypothetical protein [Phormidium ambiguum]